MKVCPHCQEKNLNSAISCACGYSFATGTRPATPAPPPVRRAASTVEGIEERRTTVTNHLIFAGFMLLLPAVMLLAAVRDYQKIKLFLAGGTEQTVTIAESPDTFRGSKGRTRVIHKVVIDGVPVRVRFVNYDVRVGDSVDIIFDRAAVQRLASSDYRYFEDFIIGRKADGLFGLMRRQQ